MNYQFQKINSNLNIALEPNKAFFVDRTLKKEVENVWENAKLSSSSLLYNDLLFNVLACNADTITGQFVEYKYFFAQKFNPSKFKKLNINPLAVTGLVRKNNKVLLGKRSMRVHQNKGIWELAPAGGVDSSALNGDIIDPISAVIQEFEEEIGLPLNKSDTRFELKLLAQDLHTKVTDIIIEISCPIDKAKLLAAATENSNTEYTEIRFFQIEDVIGEPAAIEANTLTIETLKYLYGN